MSDCGCGCSTITSTQGQNGASAFIYIAYADDAAGSGFSTSDVSKNYVAIKKSLVAIANPQASDFAGLWHHWTGPGGTNGLIITGDIDCSADPDYPAANQFDCYRVINSGRIGGNAPLTPGKRVFSYRDPNTGFLSGCDLVIAITASPSGQEAVVGQHWFVIKQTALAPGAGDGSYAQNTKPTDTIATVTGDNSIAFAGNSTVSGDSSIAIGEGNTVAANFSMAVGEANNISSTGSYHTALGFTNAISASGNGNSALGRNNTISGTSDACGIIGYNNTVSGIGFGSLAFGRDNSVSGPRANSAFGLSNVVTGSVGCNFTIGSANTINGFAGDSVAVGTINTISGSQCFVAGAQNNASSIQSHIIGYNNSSQSVYGLLIGFNGSSIIDCGFVHSASSGVTKGTRQHQNYPLITTTTTAVDTTMTVGSGNAGQFLVMPNSSIWSWELVMTATQATAGVGGTIGDWKEWRIKGRSQRHLVAAVMTTQISTVTPALGDTLWLDEATMAYVNTPNTASYDPGTPITTAVVSFDVSGTQIRVRVNGGTTDTVIWGGYIEIWQTIFA